MERSRAVVRFCARVLGGFIVAVWGYFAIAHLGGEAGRPSRALMLNVYIGIAAMVVSVTGLALAWKWELAGSIAALVPIAFGAALSPSLLVSPFVLIPLDAILFLASWWLHRSQPPT
jgi:hypothetical protein